MDDVVIVVIEGLIGAGKTTLWEELKRRYGPTESVVFLEECVDCVNLCHLNGEEFRPLRAFYANPAKEAVAMQMHIITNLAKSFRNVLSANRTRPLVVVCDRFIDSAAIFVDAMHKAGHVSDFSAAFLRNAISENKKDHDIPEPTGIFFLETPVSECQKRISRRNRPGEEGLVTSDTYLRDLYDSYKSWESRVTRRANKGTTEYADDDCETPGVLWENSLCYDLQARADEVMKFITVCRRNQGKQTANNKRKLEDLDLSETDGVSGV